MSEHNEHYWDVDRNKPVVHGDMQKVGEIKAFHTPAGTTYTAPVVDPLPGGTELYAVVDWKVRAEAAEARLREIEKDAALALDLLDAIYALYENGGAFYDCHDGSVVYMGKAVDLDAETEQKIVDLLNRLRHRDAAMKEGK